MLAWCGLGRDCDIRHVLIGHGDRVGHEVVEINMEMSRIAIVMVAIPVAIAMTIAMANQFEVLGLNCELNGSTGCDCGWIDSERSNLGGVFVIITSRDTEE